jgi:hypothetical protein
LEVVWLEIRWFRRLRGGPLLKSIYRESLPALSLVNVVLARIRLEAHHICLKDVLCLVEQASITPPSSPTTPRRNRHPTPDTRHPTLDTQHPSGSPTRSPELRAKRQKPATSKLTLPTRVGTCSLAMNRRNNSARHTRHRNVTLQRTKLS